MDSLSQSNIRLISPEKDLIDEIWPLDERDQKPNSEIKIHSLKFSGLLITFNLKLF